MSDLTVKLIDKAKEAFTMAIEIYNKPTIKYRVEGFSIFICNAWELMLKAHMINKMGADSIYYKDNPERTITLENCIRSIFTNDKDPLRLNLMKIIELRNTSTHFITEEYEMLYIPLFQSCILNFNEKISAYHNVDMTEVIPQNFLTLSVSMKALDASQIIAKYPEEIANKIIHTSETLKDLIRENNSAFAIRIEHHHYLTKNKDQATSFVKVDPHADAPVKIIKDLKDPHETHKLTAKSCISQIKQKLKKFNIDIAFNMYVFQLFVEYFELKSNNRYCYVYRHYRNPQYTYSQQVVDFIIDEIKKDPENIVQCLKDKIKEK